MGLKITIIILVASTALISFSLGAAFGTDHKIAEMHRELNRLLKQSPCVK